jgi:Cof subfamily protein (haloacid dehalogenase superfamily)
MDEACNAGDIVRAKAPRIRLLAVDVDGTLTPGDNVVTPGTRDALKRLLDAGVAITIATGRRYRTTRAIIDATGMELPAVCLGGALVKRHDHGTVAKESYAVEDYVRIVTLARDLGHSVVFQHDADLFGKQDFLVDDAVPWNDYTKRYFERSADLSHRGDAITDDHGMDVLQIGLFAEREDLLRFGEAARDRFGNKLAITMVPDSMGGGWYCEVRQAHVSKWSGLMHLAKALDIASGEICAVGDEVNDLPMIENAAAGVAMGNAHADVKAAADWVTERHDEDGLVGVVDWILG